MNAIAIFVLLLSGQAAAVDLNVSAHPSIRVIPKGTDTSWSGNVIPRGLWKRASKIDEYALMNVGEYGANIDPKEEMVVIAQEKEPGVIWLPKSVVPGDHAVHVSMVGEGKPARYLKMSQKLIEKIQRHFTSGDIEAASRTLSEAFDKANPPRPYSVADAASHALSKAFDKADLGRARRSRAAVDQSAAKRPLADKPPVSEKGKALRALKRGDKAMIRLDGAGHTTYEETEIAQVSKNKIWGVDSEVPYDRSTGDWADNSYGFAGLSRWLEPIPADGIPENR